MSKKPSDANLPVPREPPVFFIVLTKDTRIRYHAIEVNALRAAAVRAFILTAKGDLSGEEMAGIFVKALPAIKRLCARQSPPFLARVNREGNVALIG